MGKGRLSHHQDARKDFSKSDNLDLAHRSAAILNEELQGRRIAIVDEDGRVRVTTKSAEMVENPNQQIISLLLAAHAETEALRGNSMQVNAKMSSRDLEIQDTLNELIGRGLLHPDALELAGRGFRRPSDLSTDDLTAKFISDVRQIGAGYDSRDGAAFTQQKIDLGHTLDHNLHPEQSNNPDNVSAQAKIVNAVTADSAKGKSVINPKYKSIIDLRNKALELIKKQYKFGHIDTVYTDDGDLDIYGSALDDLINLIRNEESRMAATDAMPVFKALQKKEDAIQRGKLISDSQGQIIGQKPLVINVDDGSNVYVHNNGNRNGKKINMS